MQKLSSTRRVSKLLFVVLGVTILAFGGYYASHYERGPIYRYDEKRDFDEMVKMFREDTYILTASPDYSPVFAFKTRSPYKDVSYLGTMHIKVMRVDGKLAGFVTYYPMQDGITWHILFLCVGKEYRRKGYGKQLMRQAMEDIRLLGAKQIKILTRLENITAQDLYRKLGFLDDYVDPRGFVYLMYPIPNPIL